MPSSRSDAVGYANLEWVDSSHSKFYNLSIYPEGGGFMVLAEHQKIGLAPHLSPKTPTPVPYADALEVFQKAYKEKTGKGYTVKEESLPPKIAPSTSSTVSSSEDVLAKLRQLLDPALPRKMPVLLEGLPGTSKTYSTHELAKTGGFHAYKMVQGHAGVESADMLGQMVLTTDGTMIWVDGPVTAAFRAAAKGQKALLFIDEIGRIPRRERGMLLTALSPHDGNYFLRTGRPINMDKDAGVAEMETLVAPVANLSVVAATNSGSNYADVEMDDDAGKERFHIVHLEYDEKRLKKMIESRLAERGWPAALADDFLDLQAKIKVVKTDNFCEKELTPRLVMRTIDIAEGQTRPDIGRAARLLFPALTGRTPEGEINKDQESALEKAVTAFEKTGAARRGAKV